MIASTSRLTAAKMTSVRLHVVLAQLDALRSALSAHPAHEEAMPLVVEFRDLVRERNALLASLKDGA